MGSEEMSIDIIELSALQADAIAIACEVEGMRAENAQREIVGESLAYSGKDFYDMSKEAGIIAEKIRALKGKG